ncbi:MAG: cysteine desulfurase [Promicromonosporaceae bacterium]|nr:cysteine desulfurase [Promicromonosporaceae bacterium]
MSHYLDHAASTAPTPAALAAYVEEAGHAGNASSLHAAGRRARRVLEESRETVAACLDARPSEVIFTSSGTEANNLALKGIFWGRRSQDAARRRLLVSAVEHHSLLDPAFWLAGHAGAEVALAEVDQNGRLELAALAAEFGEASSTALASVMWANNEVGTLQPIAEVARLCQRFGVPLHRAAASAVGQLPVSFAASGADALTVSGHKFGAPLGVGALLTRRDLPIESLTQGGSQERGLRAGTVNVPAIRAFAVALAEATSTQAERAAHLTSLRDRLIAGVRRAVPDAVLRGPEPATGRLPGSALFTFPGCEGDSLLYLLDSAGVQASTGSACQAGIPQPSHVLLAMGVDEESARGALRFSLGSTSTEADVDALLAALPSVAERARNAGLTSAR